MNAPTVRNMTRSEQFWYQVWGKRWLARTIFSKRFWSEPFKDYPQTWYYMPQRGPGRRFCQMICGLFGGHEHSKTEWGYGGGEYVDNHCRWCDKVLKVPITEARFRHQTFNEMRPDKWTDFE